MEKQNKDLIIQDLKDVIVDLNKRINTFDKSENEYNVLLYESNEKIHKLINDLNICQSANKRQSEIIKELQLENSEVNKLLSTYKFSFYLISSIVTVVSIIGSIITLIK
jgi:flagellar biosynthesis/type III secretory pathway chaperone